MSNHQNQPQSATRYPTWAGFGNSGNSPRPAYTNAQVEAGALDGLCVLNSISDSAIGDKRHFVGIMRCDRKLVQCIDVPATEEEFQINLYVHNNNRFGPNFCARNVKVSFDLPEGTAREQTITIRIRTIPASDSDPIPADCTLNQKVRISKNNEPWKADISAQVGDKDVNLQVENTVRVEKAPPAPIP